MYGHVQEGWRPALAALERTLSRPDIKDVQRSSIAACIPSIVVDSTMKLPSEPDPGSAGSSSCVSSYSYPVGDCSTFEVLADSPTFNTATSHGPSPCDEL